MSFGYSVGDFLALTQLAWTVVDNSRKACGEHDELAREVNHLHIVLRRLSDEASKPDSFLQRDKDDRLNEFRTIARDCRHLLRVLDKQLARYNALTGQKRSFAKMWQQVRFGNGMMKSLNDVRLKVTTYTSILSLYGNLLSAESQGRVERHMYAQGGELREMRHSINLIAAAMQASHTESSVLTSYTDDEKAAWKQLRRELIRKGFSSSSLKKNKGVIKKYLLELGERGVLDERLSREHAQGREKSESPDTARSELDPSDCEEDLQQSSSPLSKVPEPGQYAEASRSKVKGKAREIIEDTQGLKSGEVSSNYFATRPTIDERDVSTETNAKESDHCADNAMLSEVTDSIKSETECGKPFPKLTSRDKIQDIGSLEETLSNCEISAGPSSEQNYAESEQATEGTGIEVLESSSETTLNTPQQVTAANDTPSKEDETRNETDPKEVERFAKPFFVKDFPQVVDLEDGSEYPVRAICAPPPPTTPRLPPKTVGSEWFQWRAEGSTWRITELDQTPPKQIRVPGLKTMPSLPRVVVVQAAKKEEEDPRQSSDNAADNSSSKFSNPTRTSPSLSSDSPRPAPETQGATSDHLMQPSSPEVATLVVGDRRGRTRTFCYRDLLGRPPLSSPSSWRRRGPISYINTDAPRERLGPPPFPSDEASDEEDWVDDPEGPCIIEVSYTTECEPRADLSRPCARSGSLPQAATVVVDTSRRRVRDYRGYYRSYYRSVSRCNGSTSRRSRSRNARSRSAGSRSARSRSESTSTVYEYERTTYYGRRQTRPVYEYDGRRGTVYYANSRPPPSRWALGYHPARFQHSVRGSSVVRRRITRTTTF